MKSKLAKLALSILLSTIAIITISALTGMFSILFYLAIPLIPVAVVIPPLLIFKKFTVPRMLLWVLAGFLIYGVSLLLGALFGSISDYSLGAGIIYGFVTFVLSAITIHTLVAADSMSRVRFFKHFGIMLALIILTCTPYAVYKIYYNSIPVIYEKDPIADYQPFTDSVPSLPTESTLKLTDNLPRLDGATALYPVYSSFVQAVYPMEANIGDLLKCTKTGNAFKNLVDGETDIIFVADPSSKQLEYARSKGVAFEIYPIGKEAFVFFVNSANKLDGLTVEQIRKIYSGEISSWRSIGGNNDEIIAYQRDEGSGSQTRFLDFMKGYKVMLPPEDRLSGGMGEMVRQVSQYKNFSAALGYSFRFYLKEMVNTNKIKLLRINGVAPSKESIINGQYPLSGNFYAIIRAGEPNENVHKMISWIQSDQGQYLVDSVGYVKAK